MNAIIRGNFSDTTVTYHFLKSLSNEGFTFEIIQGGKAVAKFKVKRGIKRRDANGVRLSGFSAHKSLLNFVYYGQAKKAKTPQV
jgi:hypothetical protein